MHSELNEKIAQTQQGIARLHKIDSILEQLKLEEEQLKQKESELKEILEEEDDDVKKLEHKSLASFFYSILGRLDEHLEKERKEALAVKLKHVQALKDLEDVERQLLTLSAERMSYINYPKEYDVLLAQKKKELLQENGETAQEIFKRTDQLNHAKMNLKEVKEALSAGVEVLNSINAVLDSLDSAEGWGTWDLLGGGLFTDLAKHSHIDDANDEVENTQRLLRHFKSELTDIRIKSDIVIETDGFAKFADFFFDGLIADWFMQSKIHNSQESVEAVKSQVLSAVHQLELMKSQELSRIERLESEINALIVKG